MLFSIVTVNYNDRAGLLKTLLSVFNQDIPRNLFELIVIDADSVDGSKDVLDEYGSDIDVCISEPDEGIFDGMNKGIKYCKNNYLIFLNSGDSFHNNETLSQIKKIIDHLESGPLIFGRVLVNGRHRDWKYPSDKVNKAGVGAWLKGHRPNHQACFFPREFYKNNYYKLQYKIASDEDYKLRAISESDFYFVDDVISVFDYQGTSSTITSFSTVLEILRELNRVYKSNSVPRIEFIKTSFHYFVKFLASNISQAHLENIVSYYHRFIKN